MASQITSLTIFYPTVYSGTDERNIKASRPGYLCGEFTGDRPETRKMFSFDDAIMYNTSLTMCIRRIHHAHCSRSVLRFLVSYEAAYFILLVSVNTLLTRYWLRSVHGPTLADLWHVTGHATRQTFTAICMSTSVCTG